MDDEDNWVLRAKDCGICSQEFDENSRCPRLLTCSHCLCTYCIKRLLADNSKFCPFCRQEFRGNSEQDFRVNTCVLDLLRYASNLEAGAVLPAGETSSCDWLKAFQSSKDAAIKDNLTLCQKARDVIVQGVQINNDFIAVLKRAAIDEEELKREYWGVILFFEEKNDRLENEKDLIEQKQQEMEQMTETLSLATSLGDAGEIVDKVVKLNGEISSGFSLLRDYTAKDEDARQRIKEILDSESVNIDVIQEFLTSEGSGDLLTRFSDLDLSTGDIPHQIEVQDLLQMTAQMRRLVSANRVFAHQQMSGRNRFAKISYTDDGKLCQHALTEEMPPPGSYVTKFSGLNCIDPTSILAFIDVTSQKSFRRCDRWGAPTDHVTLDPVVARLYVHLYRDDLRCQQFLHLCTGELAPSTSYLGAKVSVPFKLGAKIHQVRFGDYGDRGKALLPGVSQEGRGEQDSSCEAGALVGRYDEGDDLGAQFYVRMNSIEDFPCDQSFGRVQEGMDDLKRVIASINEIGYQMQVFISDCGVVLSS